MNPNFAGFILGALTGLVAGFGFGLWLVSIVAVICYSKRERS